ncbi:hypothetical protein LDO26_13985 [Luteimonas sp. BDR2-5]|uniref:hypothetical protein n=1 Tax=Proluteimonas luteida TaxID=2878685 RepID=UPI001E57C3CF|nr:hypothetical protein [Luteimonas sp. BDR2-5]MCD9029308.1 hypothetical protein [Luteimonas sp. BDR2-5]
MNAQVELNLALLLFLPWFLVLGVLFCVFPRQPRGARRVLYDMASLALAVAAFVLSIHWAQQSADPGHGRMWAQILATATGYGVFLAVLGMAFALRGRMLQPPRR